MSQVTDSEFFVDAYHAKNFDVGKSRETNFIRRIYHSIYNRLIAILIVLTLRRLL